MTTEEIGWRFPPTNGGRVDGFNDPGIANFNGAPLSSLARETIQNSLDAVWRLGEPVHVTFELLEDFTPGELGRDELMHAVEASEQAATGNAQAEQALKAARLVLERDRVSCLRVSDRNTTGLRGDQWRALVKMQGTSVKEVEGAGGSHGIGKYAPFAVSALRTVFYWTCYEEDGMQVESFQGKSVLMSHEGKEGETQGTGFYGIKDGCRELRDKDIPQRFRLLSADLQAPVHGTSLSITGFLETSDWRRRIASSVIENFFYSVHRGNLKVLIEPGQTRTDLGLLEIDDVSLGKWFDYLEENSVDAEDSGDEVGEPGFAERVKITLKPVRRAQAPVLPPENEITEEGEGDGEDTGQNGGTGTNGGDNGTGGPGDGEGEGGTGVRGGGQVRGKRIPISNVRILAVQGRENCYQVSFRANGNGVARLDLDEAGDSSAIPRDDVRPISENVSLDRFPLVNGERTQFEITADAPIGGRAWRLSATEAVGDQE